MKLSEISIKRPVFATMMVLALLVVGWFSYTGLPVELMPEVDFPFVIIQTVYSGASAESVETQVTKNLEEVINQISGVRHIMSQSREGLSLIFVEFQLEVNGDKAAQDVREKAAAIRDNLPDDIEEPIITQFDNASEPILSLAISGQRPLRDITELTKTKIKRRLETISGIGSVELVGGFEREILLRLNPEKMESYAVSIEDVRDGVSAANLEIPGGRIDESSREYLVRIMGRLSRVDDFNNIIVKNYKGVPIYLSDIAIVSDTVAEQRSLSRYNGQVAVGLNILRQSGANVVEMATQVKSTVADLRSELPPDIHIEIVNDNSRFIEDSIHEILNNIQLGTTLAIIVIFLFLLDVRATIISGLSIPISIIATFTLMKLLGFTINVLTLLGLSLAVGILIDDAIVVIENIYRHIDEGQSPFDAAFWGTKEIGLAVMATTFSIMVVFLPVAFMEGIIGRFFYQFGMTVAFAVLISLFVAFSLTPMLSSRWLRKSNEIDFNDPNLLRSTRGVKKAWYAVLKALSYWNRAFDAIVPFYKKLLEASLRHRLLVSTVAILAFVSALFLGSFLGSEFVPQTDQGKVSVSITTPPGTTLVETSERLAQIEAVVKRLPEVKGTYVTIGSGNNNVTDGSLLILLTDASQRLVTAHELVDSIRVLVSSAPGFKYAVGLGEHEGGSNKAMELSIRGENRDELTLLTHQLQQAMRGVPGAVDIDNSLEEGKPELQITVDRKQADDLGLSLAAIPLTVRSLVEGEVVTRYKDGDEEYDVRVKLDEPFRSSYAHIGRILVESDKDVPGEDKFLVPINRVARLDRATAIGEFRRFDRQNEVRVDANVLSTSFVGTVNEQTMKEVHKMQLPPGYVIEPVGTTEIMQESFQNIFKALLLAVVFIYLVLASQYESFFDPLSIMLSLPLSLIGAILGLLLAGSSLSIMSLIGIVMLMGLVTKNAILLIDFVKQRREKGVSRTEAVLISGPIRLRPILMTTFSTVFGMLPLALGLGPGAEMRAPMAQAAIGGVISSTLLTLVVVPVVYTIIDDAVAFLFRRKKESSPLTEGKKLDEQFDHAQ